MAIQGLEQKGCVYIGNEFELWILECDQDRKRSLHISFTWSGKAFSTDFLSFLQENMPSSLTCYTVFRIWLSYCMASFSGDFLSVLLVHPMDILCSPFSPVNLFSQSSGHKLHPLRTLSVLVWESSAFLCHDCYFICHSSRTWASGEQG